MSLAQNVTEEKPLVRSSDHAPSRPDSEKGRLIIWASDQRFYIEEAHHVCTKFYGLSPLAFGPVEPNAYNDLGSFPGGRTKFEDPSLARDSLATN